MEDKSIVPSPDDSSSVLSPPKLDIGRAYSANDTAAILDVTVGVLNERVREGQITPIFPTGDRRYSGYMLARFLGWPLSDDPMDYMPRRDPVESGKVRRRRRPVAVR